MITHLIFYYIQFFTHFTFDKSFDTRQFKEETNSKIDGGAQGVLDWKDSCSLFVYFCNFFCIRVKTQYVSRLKLWLIKAILFTEEKLCPGKYPLIFHAHSKRIKVLPLFLHRRPLAKVYITVSKLTTVLDIF